jgi:hypothetical protein
MSFRLPPAEAFLSISHSSFVLAVQSGCLALSVRECEVYESSHFLSIAEAKILSGVNHIDENSLLKDEKNLDTPKYGD